MEDNEGQLLKATIIYRETHYDPKKKNKGLPQRLRGIMYVYHTRHIMIVKIEHHTYY
jgi:hypothetical protein